MKKRKVYFVTSAQKKLQHVNILAICRDAGIDANKVYNWLRGDNKPRVGDDYEKFVSSVAAIGVELNYNDFIELVQL